MQSRVGETAFDRPPVSEPQDRRRERSADVHPGHPSDENVLPRDGTASIEPWHRVLNDVEESGDSPAEPDDSDQPNPLTHLWRHHRFILTWLPLRPPLF